MKLFKRLIFALTAITATLMQSYADTPVDYECALTGGGGSGIFAPYYISSLRHGRFTQSSNLQFEAAVLKHTNDSARFSYGFGAGFIAGYASDTDYDRYDAATATWYSHSMRPAAFRLQQLYGELIYRSIFIEAGMKERGSAILNQNLTSGDLVESGNTRPIPQVRIGFKDFQDIPFTKKWLQISGELAYGMMIDENWLEKQYNYYKYHITRNQLYNYKRIYFRTMPSQPFSLTIGMQAAAVFGGETDYYLKGVLTKQERHSKSVKTFFKMLLPTQDGGDGFYTGNHLGTWDIRGRYRLGNGVELSAYTSWLWEDGSGIGKLNGWDGLWGIEYKAPKPGLLSGALIEYLDFTNQSGPIHYAPGDFPDTDLTDHASGADDYYNNAAYNSYAYYGQSIGTPAMMAPIYNTDGYPAFVANAMRGFHIGIEGMITPTIDYRVKGGYRKAWGTAKIMLPKPMHLTSVMLEASWRPEKISGLSFNAKVEVDRGNMPCNAFGAMLSVRYRGMFNF